jgi:hypothetical protein
VSAKERGYAQQIFCFYDVHAIVAHSASLENRGGSIRQVCLQRPPVVVFKAHDGQSLLAIFAITSSYIHISSVLPMHSVIKETDHERISP